MKKILFLIFAAFPVLLYGQPEFESYNWNTFPSSQNTDTVKCINGAAVTMERRIFETYLNAENYFEELFVYHLKIKIESHDALSSFNKIYISLKNVIDIVNIQARFISSSGKITVLPKESIKQIANLENNGDYKTFAIEGAEVGGQIEYFYVLRRKFDPYSGYYIQDQIPRSNVEIIFAYPSKVEYQIKTYNGLSPFKLDKNNPDRTYQKSFSAYIPAIEKEGYSDYKAELMRFEYTFSYNHYNSSLRKYSWNTGCENIYKNIYDLSKSDKTAAQSLSRQIIQGEVGTEQKVRAIENWIKSNISISKEIPYQKELSDVLKRKQANNNTAIKLFVATFQAADIKFELISTSNKTNQPFDPNLNCGNFMNYYLFYFPDIDEYMSPDDAEYRLGLIPTNYQGEYGLFMRPVSYNKDLTSLAYQVRKIPLQDYRLNSDTLIIILSLLENETDIQANIRRIMTGELGRVFQNVFQNLPEDKKQEVAEQVFRMGDQNSKVSSQKLVNSDPNSIGVLPFIWDVSLQAGNLIENAGNDLIFHIGETIGQQSELYQEKSRKLPINIGMLHNYYRKITFEIPDGYKVVNPENLNMNIAMKNDDKISCTFTSEAKINGNQLVIISREYYTEESYPAERYNEFRDVINAAADFNKKTILLKKI